MNHIQSSILKLKIPWVQKWAKNIYISSEKSAKIASLVSTVFMQVFVRFFESCSGIVTIIHIASLYSIRRLFATKIDKYTV